MCESICPGTRRGAAARDKRNPLTEPRLSYVILIERRRIKTRIKVPNTRPAREIHAARSGARAADGHYREAANKAGARLVQGKPTDDERIRPARDETPQEETKRKTRNEWGYISGLYNSQIEVSIELLVNTSQLV